MIKIFLFPSHSDYEGGLKFLKENTNDERVISLYKRIDNENGFYIRKGKRTSDDADIGYSDLEYYNYKYPNIKHTLIRYETSFIGVLQ